MSLFEQFAVPAGYVSSRLGENADLAKAAGFPLSEIEGMDGHGLLAMIAARPDSMAVFMQDTRVLCHPTVAMTLVAALRSHVEQAISSPSSEVSLSHLMTGIHCVTGAMMMTAKLFDPNEPVSPTLDQKRRSPAAAEFSQYVAGVAVATRVLFDSYYDSLS